MSNMYNVAGHCFEVKGESLCKAVERIDGFRPFVVDSGEVLFSFVEGECVPQMEQVQYEFTYEDVCGKFGRTSSGYMLSLKPQAEGAFYLWVDDFENKVQMAGNWSVRLYRFAMWVGMGLMVARYDTVAVHGSCIVYKDKAVLFLGESGTGKSTHTRLWREYVDGAFLLNDDSPFIRVEDGRVWAYGSPWSGKTPCYRQERYELAGCVRLSQAPYNQIRRLPVLQAYGAIHPSCPPEFAYDGVLYDYISSFIGKLLSSVPFFHLACLPDAEAAALSCDTIFHDKL